MSEEAVARRYAYVRPGYRLASYRKVIVPLFRITVRLLVIDRKELPPIPEFVLRAVDADVCHTDEIADLLGIQREVVASAVHLSVQNGDMIVAAPRDTLSHRLLLTAKGKRTLTDMVLQTPEEIEQAFVVDGLTHTVEADARDEYLLKPKELRDL